MRIELISLIAVSLFASGLDAHADDCAQPKAAMMVSAKTPYKETIVTKGPSGKLVTSHIIQLATTKYIEQKGSWTALPISSSDLVDTLNERLKTAKFTCKHAGTEQVDGQSASVYVVDMAFEHTLIHATMWIGAQNRSLKADMSVNGQQYTTSYEYDHVQAPAGAKTLGQQ